MLKIIRAGLHTSVQDTGRFGFRRLGISQSGALDIPALKLANLLVGNAENAGALEITLGKFVATFTSPCWVALTGADCHADLDDKPLWTGWRFAVKAGQTLKMHLPRYGMRSYLAFSGGVDVPEALGSRSTDLKAGFGGFAGRLLADGDELPLGAAARLPTRETGVKQLLFGNRVRALPGPEYQEFSENAREAFWRTPWHLSPQSNRMGYRLQGPELQRTTQREMPSHGLLPGVVQVPHNGRPIVLLADAQTTGGYPRIACVIEADLYQMAQIRLGEPVHFIRCTLAEAQQAAEQQRRYLQQLAWRLHDY
ncbi:MULTISPECIES: 5-oxoprolinase subunit PxpC [Brenneria]|uniref:Allophanate hydrolase subunit 2 family protein n=1 Tax=Brenneria nigrifluens DSM 30175 = ATCC 13028 TaxID=1121120 RepID=A0A2U1UWZ1_9GAMM|nr:MULTISPECIES: 5-oxoprolinase subunit PxpC [Brenneria]EHD22483.1 urea amidolyase related protein [Brenneria sp. EniD312]PWC26140.1 allophanate hydrolase subunit 2 family protein [Brenneria nigrifluens DSM 30175 = ATCC 13028]QCR05477.1 biotin-dependent carboxyltransferase family protein [Brenneria nigrifluens DSM 30175 = ATCC 13028]